MTFEEAMEYMTKANNRGSVLGLDNIKRLLYQLDNPQNKIPVVHIAGTNGKGSILAYIGSVLQNAGYAVGRYISPTIFDYREKYQINGQYISEEDFLENFLIVKKAIDEMVLDGYNEPTAFEIETAVGFVYFFSKKVDVILLETGMGGRLDATNVVDKPLCTILASISMDHMQFLGNTIEDIADEKAGIIKKNVPVVLYPTNDKIESVVESVAVKKRANLKLIDESYIDILEQNLDKQKFIYNGEDYTIHLLGKHQIYNAVTAIETLKILMNHFVLSRKNLKIGIEKAKWNGRFEIIGHKPLIIRDGAHNADAAKKLADTIDLYFKNRRIIYIIGVLADKEYDKVLQITADRADKIITITPKNHRALDAFELAKCAKKYNDNVVAIPDIKEAMKEAQREANEKDVIIAFGSLSYIGELTK